MCRTARFQLRRRTRGLNGNPPAFRCVGERYRRSVQPLPPGTRRGVFVKARTAFLVAFVMLATAALVVVSQSMPDPLAKFRTPDGRLTIPGRALTPELQRLLFHGNDLGPLTNVTFLLPVRSSYPTERLVAISFASPNLNVFVHPRQAPETWGSAIDHVLRVWFPPVDWHEVAVGFRNSIRDGVGWFFDLFTMNAKADALTVDSTTVAVVDPAAATCTTSQSAAAGDNAVLVMLSNRGPTAYASVTYGSVSLSLIPGTATSGTGIVRSEIWFFQGAIRGGRHALPRDGNHVDGRQRHRLGHLRGSRVAHPELRRCVGELLSDRRGWDVGHGCELVEHVRRGGVRLHARCDERCDLQCHPHRHHDPCGSHDDREHRHDGLHRHARYDRIQLGAHRQRSIRHSGDVPGSEFDDYDHRGRRRAHRGDDHQSRRIELDGQRPVDQPLDLRLVGHRDEHGDDSRCDKRDAHIRGTGWRSERVQQSHAGCQRDYEHHVHDGSKPVEDGSDPHDPQLDRRGDGTDYLDDIRVELRHHRGGARHCGLREPYRQSGGHCVQRQRERQRGERLRRHGYVGMDRHGDLDERVDVRLVEPRERNDHAHDRLVHQQRQLGHERSRLRVHEGHEHGDDERCRQHRHSEREQQLQQPRHLGGGNGHPNRPRGRLRDLDGECRLNPRERHLHADRGHPRSEHGGGNHRGGGGHDDHHPRSPQRPLRILPLLWHDLELRRFVDELVDER